MNLYLKFQFKQRAEACSLCLAVALLHSNTDARVIIQKFGTSYFLLLSKIVTIRILNCLLFFPHNEFKSDQPNDKTWCYEELLREENLRNSMSLGLGVCRSTREFRNTKPYVFVFKVWVRE